MLQAGKLKTENQACNNPDKSSMNFRNRQFSRFSGFRFGAQSCLCLSRSPRVSGAVLFRIQVGGINQNSILSLSQGSHRARRTLLIAPIDGSQYVLQRAGCRRPHAISQPAPCPLLRFCRQKELKCCLRQHKRTNIAAIKHQILLACDLLLLSHQPAPNHRHRTDASDAA